MTQFSTVSLSISIVLFNSRLDYLSKTLETTLSAIKFAQTKGALGDVSIRLIDNSINPQYSTKVQEIINCLDSNQIRLVEFEKNQENNGFGAAHNQAIRDTRSDAHLILNPDVEVQEFALYYGVLTLVSKINISAVTPNAISTSGDKLFLCKRHPSLLVLFLRAFAPASIMKIFQSRLHDYEIRDLVMANSKISVPLASGCFMLCKTSILQSIEGFDPKFFMYFEDFDLSLRINEMGSIVMDPRVQIVHHGGSAAKKGLWHFWLFVRSSIRFFNTHGWRFI